MAGNGLARQSSHSSDGYVQEHVLLAPCHWHPGGELNLQRKAIRESRTSTNCIELPLVFFRDLFTSWLFFTRLPENAEH
jgi:hypothetical protein